MNVMNFQHFIISNFSELLITDEFVVIQLHPKYNYIMQWGAFFSKSEGSSFHCHCTRITMVPNFSFTVESLRFSYWCIPSIFIWNVTTLNNWVNSERMFHHTDTRGNQLMLMLRCEIMCLTSCSHICTYTAATKKVWLIYVHINYNACTNAFAYWYYAM